MGLETRRLRLTLPATELAPAQARRFLARAHCRLHHTAVLDEAQLLVSEVVTNALRHGRPPLTIEVTCEDGDALVVRVSDGSTAPPVVRDAAPDDESGRGVSMVDLLSEDWGVEPGLAGKQVWFRLRRSA